MLFHWIKFHENLAVSVGRSRCRERGPWFGAQHDRLSAGRVRHWPPLALGPPAEGPSQPPVHPRRRTIVSDDSPWTLFGAQRRLRGSGFVGRTLSSAGVDWDFVVSWMCALCDVRQCRCSCGSSPTSSWYSSAGDWSHVGQVSTNHHAVCSIHYVSYLVVGPYGQFPLLDV